MDASLLVVLVPWRRQADAGRFAPWDWSIQERIDRALRPWPTDRRRQQGNVGGLVLLDFLTPAAVLAVFDAALRADAWAAGLILRPASDPRMEAGYVAKHAKRSPWGVAVRTDRRDQTARQVDAALAAHATLLRQRTPATWRALDAVAEHRTATAAANALGCSQQAVSAHLARSNRIATSQTRVVIEALLFASTAP